MWFCEASMHFFIVSLEIDYRYFLTWITESLKSSQSILHFWAINRICQINVYYTETPCIFIKFCAHEKDLSDLLSRSTESSADWIYRELFQISCKTFSTGDTGKTWRDRRTESKWSNRVYTRRINWSIKYQTRSNLWRQKGDDLHLIILQNHFSQRRRTSSDYFFFLAFALYYCPLLFAHNICWLGWETKHCNLLIPFNQFLYVPTCANAYFKIYFYFVQLSQFWLPSGSGLLNHQLFCWRCIRLLLLFLACLNQPKLF